MRTSQLNLFFFHRKRLRNMHLSWKTKPSKRARQSLGFRWGCGETASDYSISGKSTIAVTVGSTSSFQAAYWCLGFQLGDAGHGSIPVMVSAATKLSTIRAQWWWALSSMITKFGPITPANGTTMGLRIVGNIAFHVHVAIHQYKSILPGSFISAHTRTLPPRP